MTTKTKSEIGAVLALCVVPAVVIFVKDPQLALAITGSLTGIAGWLGFRKPGQTP